MHRHIADLVAGTEQGILHAVGNRMARRDGDIAHDSDMEIDNEAEATFPHPAFFDILDTFDGESGGGDGLNDVVGCLLIKDLTEGALEHPATVENNNAAGKKRRPVVRTDPVPATDQRNRDPDRRGQ